MAAKGKASVGRRVALSAAVVGALPFVVGLLTFFFNPGYLNEFVINPKGPTLIFAFVILLSTGLFVTHLYDTAEWRRLMSRTTLIIQLVTVLVLALTAVLLFLEDGK